jgi:hypothetical protein
MSGLVGGKSLFESGHEIDESIKNFAVGAATWESEVHVNVSHHTQHARTHAAWVAGPHLYGRC